MIDSSAPVTGAPDVPVRAFYIGGQTPHIWTDREIGQLTSRWALPIFVNVRQGESAAADATYIIDWLRSHGWDRGSTVAVDTEAVIEPGYLAALDQHVGAAGWLLMDYQSKVAVAGNPVTSGGRWVADWTGQPHLRDGDNATQYLPGSMSGKPWDESLIRATVKLHQLNKPLPPPPPQYQVTVLLPALYEGLSGLTVRNLQGLLNAQADAHEVLLAIDGIFGPATAARVASYQRSRDLAHVPGVAGPTTWHALLSSKPPHI